MKFGNVLAIVVGSLVMHSTLSHAAVTINVSEVGVDVVASATGSFNYRDLTYVGTTTSTGGMVGGSAATGRDGLLYLSPSSQRIKLYRIDTTIAFSTGSTFLASATTGTNIGIFSASPADSDFILVLESYASGSPITASATWSNHSFASLGLIPGEYVVTWGSGDNADSFTVIIGAEPPPTYTVGGDVTGLVGSGLVLQNNGGDDLDIAADGSFVFTSALVDLSDYAVTVLTQPTSPNQTCAVNKGSGTIAAANVTDVVVTCVTAKADQTITGLAANPATGVVEGSSTLSATASSGLTVSFGSSTAAVCTVSGTTVSYLTAGTCTVTADQAGDAAYNAATQVTLDIVVGKADQTITGLTADPASGLVGGTSTLSVGGGAVAHVAQSGQKPPTTKASGIPVTFGSNTLTICTVNGSTVSYLAVGTCTVTADQAGDADYNPAPQSTLDIEVTESLPVVPNVPIPTLSLWGLATLFLMMLAIGGMIVRHRTRG